MKINLYFYLQIRCWAHYKSFMCLILIKLPPKKSKKSEFVEHLLESLMPPLKLEITELLHLAQGKLMRKKA